MAKFNGHKNWNHWNVSLWLLNDEGLYDICKHAVLLADNLDEAARAILQGLHEQGHDWTKDGAPYTFTTIRAALRGWS